MLVLDGIFNYVEEEKLKQNSMSGFQNQGNMKNLSSNTLLLHERPRPQKAFFEQQQGGLLSADGKHLYFMGIIDTLTGYGGRKMIEHAAKSIVYDSKTISCIPPM